MSFGATKSKGLNKIAKIQQEMCALQNTPVYINRGFSFHGGIMWPSLGKIQYTELKFLCGNDPVVRNSTYSNGDLDL